ncbi:MAG: hypothetical protein ACOCU9_04275 [Spirochaetota bacterium]
MRRVLTIALLATILLTPVVAQEQETWINTEDDISAILPGGMLLYVSRGLSYDEWDAIFRSPSELSNYSGIGVVTAYGNYDDPVAPANNPFLPGLTPEDFLFGFTFDMFGVRAGALAGYEFAKTGNITNPDQTAGVDLPTAAHTPPWTEWTYSNAETVDAAADGTADYNYSTEIDVTDFTKDTTASFTVGADLGFMGVSFLGSQSLSSRIYGGTVDYTWSEGETTTPNDQLTAATVRYGTDEEGRPRGFADGGQEVDLYALGDLPLNLLGYSTPLAVTLGFTSETNGPLYAPPARYSFTTSNPTGAAADDTSTLTSTVGDANVFDNGWFTTITGYEDTAQTEAQLIGLANGQVGDYALDEGSGADTGISLYGKIDPSIPLGENVTARTRLGLGYEFGRDHNPRSGSYDVNLSLANSTGTNSVYTVSGTNTDAQTTVTHTITSELGGVFDLRSDDSRLSLKTGLFYLPEISLGSVTWADDVETTERSWTDETGTDPDATDTTAAADIQPGNTQGSSTLTTTTSYTDSGKDNEVVHAFAIPVSVSFDLVPEKWTLVGGYRLDHDVTTTTQTVPDATATTTTTVQNSAGDVVSPDPADDASETVEGESLKNVVNTGWNGTMDFMVRWTPTESMTLDLYGDFLMTALNQGLLSFNPTYFLSNLGISASFRF